jgi:hypothetical protein
MSKRRRSYDPYKNRNPYPKSSSPYSKPKRPKTFKLQKRPWWQRWLRRLVGIIDDE